MEKIIKNILNYDASTASDEERNKIGAEITALSMHLLNKSGYFEDLSELEIKTINNYIGGSYGNGLIEVSENMFKDKQSFVNDITILTHEVCHYAQENCKDKSENIYAGKGLNCTPDHFDYLFLYILTYEKPDLMPIIRTYGINMARQFDEDVNKLYLYFNSFYELQPFEVEANDFSLKVLKFIERTAQKMELSDKEKNNLQNLKSMLAQTKSFYDKREKMRMIHKNKDFVKKVKSSAVKVIGSYLHHKPEFYQMLDKSGVDICPNSDELNIINLSNLVLEFNYDDEFAKSLLNMLLEAKPSVYRDRCLFDLALWTKIDLSKEQEQKLRQIHEKTEVDIKSIDFDTLLKEKARVEKERELLTCGKRENVRKFDFE